MSSSATNTLTKRRSLPVSSKSRSPKPGWAASRALSTSPTVAAFDGDLAGPAGEGRSWVGMRTGDGHDLEHLFELDGGGEGVQGRGDGGRRAADRGDRVDVFSPLPVT